MDGSLSHVHKHISWFASTYLTIKLRGTMINTLYDMKIITKRYLTHAAPAKRLKFRIYLKIKNVEAQLVVKLTETAGYLQIKL